MNGKEVIGKIQNEIKEQKDKGIWRGYINLQKLTSGDIWESPTRYLYELLQNAEDAEAKEFSIFLSKRRVKIVHDGRPLTEEDVRNICYATSKKDPNDTIGYLGVGFRSVFAITNKPEIYSGEFKFKFDKDECLDDFGEEFVFYFYPYWIEQPVENINLKKTTFILPFKKEDLFDKTINELKNLGAQSLLFLRNIKKLSIHDEVNNTTRVFTLVPPNNLTPLSENREVKVGKFLLIAEGNAVQFLVFRGAFEVPEKIRNDEETKRAKRDKVQSRVVSIAIKLDEEENLIPTKGYLCSFFPIEERKINFIVHADLIVQAGRVALLDNAWNKWVIEKAREIAEIAYHYFQDNPENEKWIEQSPQIFEEREEIREIYDDIFEKPLFEIAKNPKVVCIEGEKCFLNEAVKITEDTEELIKKGHIKCTDMQVLYKDREHLIRKDYPLGGRKVEELSIDKINSVEFIKSKADVKEKLSFLIDFYPIYKKALIKRYSHYSKDQRDGSIQAGLEKLLVIDINGNIKKQDEVWSEPDRKIFEELKKKGIDVNETEILSEFTLIDKELWNKRSDYLPKVNKITKEIIVERCILPKLKIESEQPPNKDIISWTFLLKVSGYHPKDELWVLTTDGTIKKSSEVFLSDAYEPTYKIQNFGLPKISFLSDEYLKIDKDIDGWKKFFKETSMKGYEKEDYTSYMRNEVVPILIDGEKIHKLSIDKIIKYTQGIVECEISVNEPIFVVLKDESISKSDGEIYFSAEYSPKQNWENQTIINLKFITPQYIEDKNSTPKWKNFFKKIGVREEASNEMISEFGKDLVKKKFEKDGYKVEPYGGRADLKATKDDKTIFIEVRAISSDICDESLDSKKSKFAEDEKDNFYLAKVTNIPDAPIVYLLKNLSQYKEVELEMKIPKIVFERYGEKISAKEILSN